MTQTFSGFPTGTCQVTLVSPSYTVPDLKLTGMRFHPGIGTMTVQHAYWDQDPGDIGYAPYDAPSQNGFHDCEHAYFEIDDGSNDYVDWVCSVWGTGHSVIDEMTATCRYRGGGYSEHSNITEFETTIIVV